MIADMATSPMTRMKELDTVEEKVVSMTEEFY